MSEAPNVRAFCRELRKRGMTVLDGVDPRIVDFIEHEIEQTDLCCSAAITATLESEWPLGEEEAVRAALEEWVGVVRSHLDGLFGPHSLFPWKQCGVSDEEVEDLFYAVDRIQLRVDDEAIAALVAAAARPETPDHA